MSFELNKHEEILKRFRDNVAVLEKLERSMEVQPPSEQNTSILEKLPSSYKFQHEISKAGGRQVKEFKVYHELTPLRAAGPKEPPREVSYVRLIKHRYENVVARLKKRRPRRAQSPGPAPGPGPSFPPLHNKRQQRQSVSLPALVVHRRAP
jgi:hypothetical protein